jgi:hypothetical protein
MTTLNHPWQRPSKSLRSKTTGCAKQRCHRNAIRSRRSRFESLEERLALTWNSDTLIDNGDPNRRIDIVFVGDGFEDTDNTLPDLSDYTNTVGTVSSTIFTHQPFDQYASYFNVHRVDVISIESGISLPGDPSDTALDGLGSTTNQFYSINIAAVHNAAGDAPDWDLIQVILNGPGRGNIYSTDVALLGIHEGAATHLHELGHSLGDLGDEYVEITGDYPGGEPGDRNLTTYATEQEMINAQEKWYLWLDEPGIGVEEGGGKWSNDIYRPSVNSIMRHHTVPGATFDVVGREALII